jgi:hypothetical protein
MKDDSITNCWNNRKESKWITVQPLSLPRSKSRDILGENLWTTTFNSVILTLNSYSWIQWNFQTDSHVKMWMWSFFDVSVTNSFPIVRVCWLFVRIITDDSNLTIGTKVVPEKSVKLHILTRLFARENLIEFCRRESFMTCTSYSGI